MKRLLSANESEQRWKVLRNRQKVPQPQVSSPSEGAAAETKNPFDCSDLTILASPGRVEQVLERSVQEWKHLNERKIVDNSARKRQWGWTAHRTKLLPDGFDYATTRASPPTKDDFEDPTKFPRVVSLENPMLQHSYEGELWKLFESVPTVEELESQVLTSARAHHSRALHDRISHALQTNTRSDNHGLARMRMSHRHGLPMEENNNQDNLVTTVKLECWRRQLKRGSTPDAHRAELEFLGTQTLREVHNAIVEMTDDGLWRADSTAATESLSGVFFIEDTFYHVGSTDYVGPLQKWLQGDGSVNLALHRRTYLGISGDECKKRSMNDVRLDQLNWRLGVRYYHCHRGDVECSVFLTDIRQGPRSTLSSYPILHDVWTPSYSLVECDACRHFVGGLVASASNAVTDGGPRAICRACFVVLHPSKRQEKDPVTVQNYSVWRNQMDLSVGHDKPTELF